MKTVTIRGIMADFLDSIRAYEHESGKAIHYDERESSEFVDMYFNGGGKINIEESNADRENNQMKQNRIVKTSGQVMDEINQMNDGSIMEIYKVKEGFKTKNQSGWVPAPTDDLCHKCGGVMKFTGISKLSLPAQNEYRCEKCKHVQYRIKKEMKKYRLKQWYPSLQKKTIEGNIANWDFDERAYTVTQNGDRVEILDKTEVENNPDFWELIEEKEPLFTTEDGVEVFNEETTVYCITRGHNKHEENYRSMRKIESYLKIFFHESNADEYIWRNMRVFSYNDIEKYQSGGEGVFYDVKAIAKERSEG